MSCLSVYLVCFISKMIPLILAEFGIEVYTESYWMNFIVVYTQSLYNPYFAYSSNQRSSNEKTYIYTTQCTKFVIMQLCS